MFTGIVQAIGQVLAIEPHGDALHGDRRLRIDTSPLPSDRIAPGASIAVNGACLTVAARDRGLASFDISRETLGVTTLGRLAAGDRVNLEGALTLAEPLGGHLVSGHVDGFGEVVAIEPDVRSTRMTLRLPAGLIRYVASKGSLCVDGVSLTVNEVTGDRAAVNLVPHTLQSTIMGAYAIGTQVNIEVDLLARYLARLLESRA